jgi:hypothetical protein
MRLYFTARNNLGSKLIQWATDGDVSHCAIGFYGAVYHSTEHGFLQQRADEFASKYKIVRTLDFDVDDNMAMQIFTAAIKFDAGYDYSAFAFFAWCAFREKFFGKTLPKRNRWNSNGYLCTEAVGYADQISEAITGESLLAPSVDLAITSPIELFNLLKPKASKVIECY